MRFSVVIPLYNKEAHISETIESLLNQSFSDFEVLVVDDGSTDNSLEVAKKYESDRIRVLTKQNGGTASARNLGINKARGTHICFLDADDYWLPHFLDTIDELITEFPQAGIYCAAYTFMKSGRQYHPGWHGLPSDEESFLVPDYFQSTLYGEQVATTSSACVPIKVFEDVGPFDQTMRHTEDQELWNRIAMKYRVAFHTKLSAVYRQDAQNMKTKRVPKHEIEFAAKLQQQLDNGQVPEEKQEVAKKIIAANLIGLASLNLLSGDKKTARKFLSDPRTNNFPERKKAWEKLLPLPPFIIRWMYALRNKAQNRR